MHANANASHGTDCWDYFFSDLLRDDDVANVVTRRIGGSQMSAPKVSRITLAEAPRGMTTTGMSTPARR